MKENKAVLVDKAMIGRRLSDLQTQHRYSNKFISLEAGLKNYQALKSGKVMPTILTLYKLSQFYNITIEFLVHGQEYNERKQIPENSELINKSQKILELSDENKYIAMQVIDLIIYKQNYLELVKRK